MEYHPKFQTVMKEEIAKWILILHEGISKISQIIMCVRKQSSILDFQLSRNHSLGSEFFQGRRFLSNGCLPYLWCSYYHTRRIRACVMSPRAKPLRHDVISFAINSPVVKVDIAFNGSNASRFEPGLGMDPPGTRNVSQSKKKDS